MSYSYPGYVQTLANLAGTSTTQPNFVIELPSAIEYAENRICRDLDLIANDAVDASQTTTPLVRNVPVPAGVVVLKGVSLVTPAGAISATNGTRNPLVPVSKDFLDWMWPSALNPSTPSKFFYQTQGAGSSLGGIILGPWPDAAYQVVYTGSVRPTPLSPANIQTFLTLNLPDLFLVASMIHMAAYQKNWSAVGNDPASAQTWEVQYQKLLVAASAEEVRKRFFGTTVIPPRGMDTQPTSPEARP
jgi:hypothetical protein